MARGWCPWCDQLVGISNNGKDPKTTNKRQRIDLHARPDPHKPDQKVICAGSGEDI